MNILEASLRAHPLFADLGEAMIRQIAACARDRHFDAGQYLFREGGPADEFFLVREGRVGLEAHAPGGAAILFSTLGAGEIIGASWLVPPHRWMFDARASVSTQTICVDAVCLRNQFETDHELGYALMARFLPAFVKRLHATRIQLFDLYGGQAR